MFLINWQVLLALWRQPVRRSSPASRGGLPEINSSLISPPSRLCLCVLSAVTGLTWEPPGASFSCSPEHRLQLGPLSLLMPVQASDLSFSLSPGEAVPRAGVLLETPPPTPSKVALPPSSVPASRLMFTTKYQVHFICFLASPTPRRQGLASCLHS